MNFVRWQQHIEETVPPPYRLWVNDDRTILLRVWATGAAEAAFRDNPAQTWGPPVELAEERA